MIVPVGNLVVALAAAKYKDQNDLAYFWQVPEKKEK